MNKQRVGWKALAGIERDSPLCGGTGWRGEATAMIRRQPNTKKKIKGVPIPGWRRRSFDPKGYIVALWAPLCPPLTSSSSSSSSSSPSSSTARAVARIGSTFSGPAITNGAICLSSNNRPPHFASHLPDSSLFLSRPLSPSYFRFSFSSSSSSSSTERASATSSFSSFSSAGRSTFRPSSHAFSLFPPTPATFVDRQLFFVLTADRSYSCKRRKKENDSARERD